MSDTNGFARVSLEQSRKLAKELVKAHRAGDRRALDRICWNHPRFRQQSHEQIAQGAFALADAQLVIARQHYFESWAKLRDYVRAVEQADPVVQRFERAADAIIAGDLPELQAMLDAYPPLIRQRSTRGHHSTLLHYVSANGVEDYRQITPANIVDITTVLLDRGAEVDATSEAYGGGSTTLGLVATSAHPRARGVQIALIDLLLARGAKIDGEDDLPKLVSAALANGCPEAAMALAQRGARVNTLYAAAGIGDLARVHALFPSASRAKRERALMVAAQQGHTAVVTFLLDAGVDVAASDGMTALHNASAGGHLALIRELIARGAPLEALNNFGGTVLSSTLWFALHLTDDEFRRRPLLSAIELLIAEGARVDAYPELATEINRAYARAQRLNNRH
jgi:hypothetical protein